MVQIHFSDPLFPFPSSLTVQFSFLPSPSLPTECPPLPSLLPSPPLNYPPLPSASECRSLYGPIATRLPVAPFPSPFPSFSSPQPPSPLLFTISFIHFSILSYVFFFFLSPLFSLPFSSPWFPLTVFLYFSRLVSFILFIFLIFVFLFPSPFFFPLI